MDDDEPIGNAEFDRLMTMGATANLIKERDNLRDELAEAQAAINETLQLADFLNDAAANGAGFVDHWGERVVQTVEPLRDVTAFAGETLEHNRTLLEYNGRLIRERGELKQRLEAAERVVEAARAYINHKPECDLYIHAPGTLAKCSCGLSQWEEKNK